MHNLTNSQNEFENDYENLVSKISKTFSKGKQKAVNSVTEELLKAYWKVGENIIEFEQKGKRAEYCSKLLETLSKDLTIIHRKGFSLSNLKRMRQFYTKYPNSATLSHQLSWSHYVELLKI